MMHGGESSHRRTRHGVSISSLGSFVMVEEEDGSISVFGTGLRSRQRVPPALLHAGFFDQFGFDPSLGGADDDGDDINDVDYEPTEAPLGPAASHPSSFVVPILPKRSVVHKRMACVTDEQVCAVCLDSFRSRQHVRVLGCGHLFHVRCIDQWAQRKDTCPSCRCSMRGVAAADSAAPPTRTSPRLNALSATAAPESGE